jgi:hypothetical protein
VRDCRVETVNRDRRGVIHHFTALTARSEAWPTTHAAEIPALLGAALIPDGGRSARFSHWNSPHAIGMAFTRQAEFNGTK